MGRSILFTIVRLWLHKLKSFDRSGWRPQHQYLVTAHSKPSSTRIRSRLSINSNGLRYRGFRERRVAEWLDPHESTHIILLAELLKVQHHSP